jgi:membrane fusion protein (multidrug efflux system)
MTMSPLDELMASKDTEVSLPGETSDSLGTSAPTSVNILFYEQGRIRAEMDRLNREQAEARERDAAKQTPPNKTAEDGSAKEKPKPSGGDAGSRSKDGKSTDAPQPGKSDDKDPNEDHDKDPPKEPFLRRMAVWIRQHPVRFLFGIIAFLVLLVGCFFLWRYLQSYESTDDAQVDGHVDPISSRISGTVRLVHIEDNQKVSRGEVAVELDPRDYDVALAQQKANLAQAQANLEAQNPNVPITQLTQATGVSNAELDVTSAEAGYLAQQQQVQSALADLAQAEANAANASVEEKRYRTLAEEQEVSREQYDQRLADTRAQDANVSSRTAVAAAARKASDQREASLQQAVAVASQVKRNSLRQVAVQRSTVGAREAAAQISRAQVDQAVLNLSYCTIYAPVNGIIGNKSVEIGTQVSIGQELFDVTPIDDLWITANFKETQLRKMRAGQSVTIAIDTFGKSFDGYIESMPGATGARYSLLPPENATGNYVKVVQRLPVRIRLKPNQDGADRLRIGMSVEPKVWLR